MRVGIVGLLHESNTFLRQPTTIADFRDHTLLSGSAILETFSNSHHEIGGFLAGLEAGGATAVPIFVARALPSGTIDADCWNELLSRMHEAMDNAGPVDGLLVAPHGATVSQPHPDADGHWLSTVRSKVGPDIPIIGTIDPHANLSPAMVQACDALIAYRTNPHLDQFQRGQEAAGLMVRTLKREVTPKMGAVFPPMAINIERQMPEEPHLRPVYDLADRQLQDGRTLSNSIVLGFPYADVQEMGSATIAIADGDRELAQRAAQELAAELWQRRHDLVGHLVSIEEALDQCEQLHGRVCLLDMGDNVGGGSAADGTFLLHALHQRQVADAFVCILDPQAVEFAADAGIGARLFLTIGGKTDDLHGPPFSADFQVRSIHEGKFHEPQVRHGGMTHFDQGKTAILTTEAGLTIMVTSKRMVPFSLQQLVSCGLPPTDFRILVAKGVNAPIAAYREVCEHFIKVNTPGSTWADMVQLPFSRRRTPMFPFETYASFDAASEVLR